MNTLEDHIVSNGFIPVQMALKKKDKSERVL